ncbi:DNA-3-methyladenine glycosylase [Geodermatophilus obscurus]|uniref:Putative 3-methyladenine DNA glycosylase n=1 Tax=Geodermatophilus obscurus (strain ATCC 25078 / DSM 43160 / JCM 3152 / CCUG 61914 / KCC A-0152 / KCTC 9177 / NBRC 13315 / NRRL B-3577 / G-20) TaxID=526225 RepID=D2S8Q0_GEOOG|nr:DNA-3-methyladenine glycosylase [Geodermatophilus obscurus]ADB75631.1 DNA-3-methyladenine glycosylase [Geodermatophilus obscurus DSM 43160]
MVPGPLLTPEELLGPSDAVAPTLLGCWLVTDRPAGRVALRLTEVEAYAGDGTDPAAHSHRGPTPRAAVMFGPPGRLYVYFSYGVHWCANVVVGAEGQGSAVLLRAGDVVAGEELAASRRPAAKAARDLARGPARLTQALAIGPDDKDADLLDPSSSVRLHRGDPPAQVSAGPRVGISVATELPWRFWETGAASVSAFRPGGKPRRRTAGQDRDR